MNSKKVLTFSFLALFAFVSLSGFASANWWTETFQPWAFSFVSPIGFDDQWTGIVIGILATIVIFVILLDIAQLALPFSQWVNVVLAIAFVLAAGFLGIIRSVAGWALGISGLIAGGAGILAMVLSSVMLLLVISFLFFGGLKLQKWITETKGRRTILEEERKAYKEAAAMRRGKIELKETGRSA